MARYDLTKLYCEYLDPHLTFPLLEFLCAREIYDNRGILESILDTVVKTNMIDYTMDTRKRLSLGDAMPQELIQRKLDVIRTLKRLQNKVAPIMKATELLQSGEITKDSKTFINALQRDFNFTAEHLESAYKLAKYLYECGNYQEANSYLYFCLIVMLPDDPNYLNVLWGKLATEILTLNWNTAMEDLMRLRDHIDSTNFKSIEGLHQRSWLIHWSVLIFFNHPKGRDIMVDMFVYKMEYLNAIHTRCPHILRYLATGVIMSYSPRPVLNDVVKIIEQESYAYRDPITEFLERLLVHFDFEGARLKLQECQQVILHDFFIVGCLHDFVDGARLLIFETYCRIHKTITIAMLAEKLTMSIDEAEMWVVNLIRSARLDAKIDLMNGYIIMGTQPKASCQHLMEKIDALSVRTRNLGDFVERVHKHRNPDQVDAWKYYKDK